MLFKKSPSVAKMRFLLHLQDYLHVSHDGIIHGVLVLESLKRWACWNTARLESLEGHHPNGASNPSFDELQGLSENLSFCSERFDELRARLKEVQEVSRQHLQLSQESRLFRLTILASIFLPLSFATSLFGMNLDSATPEGPAGFSQWTNEYLSALPQDGIVGNATAALVSIIGTSGALTYRWQLIAIVACSLLLILPLYLVFGATLRMFIKSLMFHTIYRANISLFATMMLFFSVIAGWPAQVLEYLTNRIFGPNRAKRRAATSGSV